MFIMKDCNLLFNKENFSKSPLIKELSQLESSERSIEDLYRTMHTESFKDDFGDWQTEISYPTESKTIDPKRIHPTGEPRLFYNPITMDYYYINKEGVKKSFPVRDNILRERLGGEIFHKMIEHISASYILPNLNINKFNELNLNKIDGLLSDHISKEIDNIVNYLKDLYEKSNDFKYFVESEGIRNSKKNMAEWVDHVQSYFAELGLNVRDEVTSEDISASEFSSSQFKSYGKSSFEFSNKDSLSNNMKLRLSFIQNKDTIDTNGFRYYEFVPFQTVFSDLKDINSRLNLQYGKDNFEVLLGAIKEAAKLKPYLGSVVDTFTGDQIDQNLKNQFLQAFNLTKNEFKDTRVEKTQDLEGNNKTEVSNINLSQYADSRYREKNRWKIDLISMNEIDGEFNHDKMIGNYSTALEYLQSVKDGLRDADSKPNYLRLRSNFKTMLDSIGVSMEVKGNTYAAIDLFASKFKIEDSSELDKINNLSTAIDKLEWHLKDVLKGQADPSKDMFNTHNLFNELAEALAFFSPNKYETTVRSVNKSLWVESFPTYLSSKLKEWYNNPDKLIDFYESNPNSKSSQILKYIIGNDDGLTLNQKRSNIKNRLPLFGIETFSSIYNRGDSSDARDARDLKPGDFLFLTLHNTLAGEYSYQEPSLVSPIPGDKGTQYSIKVPKNFIKKGVYNHGDIMYDYFLGEYDRIIQTQEVIDRGDSKEFVKNMHTGDKNGLKFILFPEFNFENFDSKKYGFELYDENGNILKDIDFVRNSEFTLFRNLDRNSIKYKIQSKFHEFLVSQYSKTLENLVKNDLIGFKDGEYFPKNIDNRIWIGYSKGLSNKQTAMSIAGDYFFNNAVGQIEYSKLYMGDFAYYKSMDDYMKRVNGSYIDGQQLIPTNNIKDSNFNVAIIRNVEVSSRYIDAMSEVVGKNIADKFTHIDSTDAQAWISLDRWKFIMTGLGRFDSIAESVYRKLNLEDKEPFTKEEIKVASAPLKGVFFSNVNGRPVFLKYSQFVVSPLIAEGNPELSKVIDDMTKGSDGKELPYHEQIHELVTDSGIKVGSPISTDTHLTDGSMNLEAVNDYNVMSLSNSDWRLQQQTPVSGYGMYRVGSQMQRSMYLALLPRLKETFTLDNGEAISGKELLDRMDKISKDKVDEGFESFINKYGIGSDNKIENMERMYDSLKRQLINSGAATSNIKEALEAQVPLFTMPGINNTLEYLFASQAKNMIARISTNGGQYTQAAHYGFTKTDADNAGVKYTPWALDKPHPVQYLLDENGDRVKRTYFGSDGKEVTKEVIRPSGILISGDFISKYIPKWRDFSQSELFGTKENNYEDGLIDRRILQNVIGYRIPTQELASIDALEIVGILPEGHPDTVVPYMEVTTKTGSDFDIDKMFVMMPTMKPSFKKDKLIRDILYNRIEGSNWKETFNNIKDLVYNLDADDSLNIINKAKNIRKEQNRGNNIEDYMNSLIELVKDSDSKFAISLREEFPAIEVGRLEYDSNDLSTQLIESYKAIMMQESVLPEKYSPIDYVFMKEDIKSRLGVRSSETFSGVNINNLANLKEEYTAGAAGIGMSANMLSDHSIGIGKNKKISARVNKDITMTYNLDPIRSDKITKEDAESYLKKLSKINPNHGMNINDILDIKVSNTISAILNGFVDIETDTYITQGNWSLNTSNTGLTMARIGIHPFKINSLLDSEALRDFADFTSKFGTLYSDNVDNIVQEFVDGKNIEEISKIKQVELNGKMVDPVEIYKNYGGKASSVAKSINNVANAYLGTSHKQTDLIKLEELINEMKSLEVFGQDIFQTIPLNFSKNSLSEVQNKLKDYNTALGTFLHHRRLSNNLTEGIRSLKSNVDGYGKTSMSLLASKNSLVTALNNENYSGFYKDFINEDGSYTYPGYIAQRVIFDMEKVFKANPKIFFTSHDKFGDIMNKISNSIFGNDLQNDKLSDSLERSLYTYIMSNLPVLQTDATERRRLLTSVPKRVMEMKKSGTNNYFINTLEVSTDSNKVKFVGMSNQELNLDAKNRLSLGFLDLLETEFGNDLVKYSFITSGFQNTMHSFHQYIPYQFFLRNGIMDFVNEFTESLNSEKNIDDFADFFFKSNIHNEEYVPTIYRATNENTKDIITRFPKGPFRSTSLGIQIKDPKLINRAYLKGTYVENNGFEDVVHTLLYKNVGITVEGDNEVGLFARTNLINYSDSSGHRIIEINSGDTSESMIKSNLVRHSGKVIDTDAEALNVINNGLGDAPIRDRFTEPLNKGSSYSNLNETIQYINNRKKLKYNSEGMDIQDNPNMITDGLSDVYTVEVINRVPDKPLLTSDKEISNLYNNFPNNLVIGNKPSEVFNSIEDFSKYLAFLDLVTAHEGHSDESYKRAKILFDNWKQYNENINKGKVEVVKSTNKNNETSNKSPIVMTNKSIGEVTELINSRIKSKELSIGEDSNTYVNTSESNDVYDRVSTKKPGFDPAFEAKQAAERGNRADELLRVFLEFPNVGNKLSNEYREFALNIVESRDNGVTISKEYINNITQIFWDIHNEVTKAGFEFIPNLPTLWGEVNGEKVAGTLDVIAVNRKTNSAIILDLKTSHVNRLNDYRSGKYNFEGGDTIQLSYYAELFEQLTGINVTNIGVIPVQSSLIRGEEMFNYYRATLNKVNYNSNIVELGRVDVNNLDSDIRSGFSPKIPQGESLSGLDLNNLELNKNRVTAHHNLTNVENVGEINKTLPTPNELENLFNSNNNNETETC